MTQTLEAAPGSGIPIELARSRRASIRSLMYGLSLTIPRAQHDAILGHVSLKFSLAPDADWPLIDFAPADDDAESARQLLALRLNGSDCRFALVDGHIKIVAARPRSGEHLVECDFRAGSAALHRRADIVYTLFVPAHAHRVFPCFDQPDLKAPLTLELDMPSDWEVLTNSPPSTLAVDGDRRRLTFEPTAPLPTYLYAFVAGRLESQSHALGKRTLRLLSRADAAAALERNRQPILDAHETALGLLEQYTGIAYPFNQLGVALIPDFEFAGMEHPGATFYRQGLILLPREPDTAASMRRANLIAHEMAHMWFGNLVTMRWFDDVWLKEVFANFMADKLVAALFPAVEPTSAFVLRHWPPALAIDRTEGARPIRQALDNLAAAAELYDATIYHKAPIAVTELELRIGDGAMQRGLRRYLSDFRFGNADWFELRERLQSETDVDLTDFSRRWIESPGPPSRDEAAHDPAVCDPAALDPGVRVPAVHVPAVHVPATHDRKAGPAHPPCYGRYMLDAAARQRALDRLERTGDASERCMSWLALYEDMLDAGIAPARLLTAALTVVDEDADPLLVARVLEDLGEIFWRYLTPVQRSFAAGPVERSLGLHLIDRRAARRLYWLGAACELATSEPMLARLGSIWRGELPQFKSVPESLGARIGVTLALQRSDSANDIVHELVTRTKDAARRLKLEFLAPALSPERAERERFFERLLACRSRSVWCVTGLRLLNAAGRADDSLGYLEPGLEHAAEIRRRGDIFLPRQWLEALFFGHGTPEAAATIRSYLARPGLAERFRQLVLQTADPVFRAARIRG